MNINTVIVSVIGLIIGFGGGYVLASDRQPVPAPMEHNMNTTMSGMTSNLESKQGVEFEQAFLSEMITHHEGAVAMAQQVLAKTQRPELVKLANDIIAAQTAEIQMMKNWQQAWFAAQN